MIEKNAVLAEAYYTAMNNKDLQGTAKYLHPEAHFMSPFADLNGKEAVAEGIKQFMSFFKNLEIRTKFGSDNQAMLAYDAYFPEPIGIVRTAALLTFKDNLIINVELFFDARIFTAV